MRNTCGLTHLCLGVLLRVFPCEKGKVYSLLYHDFGMYVICLLLAFMMATIKVYYEFVVGKLSVSCNNDEHGWQHVSACIDSNSKSHFFVSMINEWIWIIFDPFV